MFSEHKKELLIAVVLVAVLFFAADFLGGFLVPSTTEPTIATELILLALAVLVFPALIGTIPSGYLIGKKTQDIKPAIFVPAFGAAMAALLMMLVAVIQLLLLSDVQWQAQLAEASAYGLDFFGKMTLEEFKAMAIASTAFGAVFLAVFNFAIGLAGGFLGSLIALRMKAP